MKGGKPLSRPFPTYSDDTNTGQESRALRDFGRATIAARIDDPNGFEWLLRVRKDFLPPNAEAKATLVLAVIAKNSQARDIVLRNIGRASIVISDLGEHYRNLLSALYEGMGKKVPAQIDAIDLIARTEIKEEISGQILDYLRETAISQTVIPQIEGVLRYAATRAGLPPGEKDKVVDRAALRGLDQKGFQEFTTRFAVAFADSTSPERRAAAILEVMSSGHILDPGYVGLVSLGSDVSHDYVFDVGNAKAFRELEQAHRRIQDAFEAVRETFFWTNLRGGKVAQEDSAQMLGIQAADVAAGLASRIYEKFSGDRSSAAKSLKNDFERVLLNDRWV